ncbi:MAG: formate/nitrite transporter family protein [Muribaculaceae bacterium]|nr:formate/nitrite transporter family protein [Muribaculaceae bacterium]
MKNSKAYFAASALLAGACIGIAAMTYVRLGGIMGCVIFAFGLMSVVFFDLKLYTGKSQFVWGRRRPDDPSSMSYGQLGAILVLNIVGCAAMSLIAEPGVGEVNPDAIVGKRLSDGIILSGLRAIPCGFIMTLSVRSARTGLWWPLLFGVPTFIICSFPHCIADVYYYATCSKELLTANPVRMVAVYLSTVVGNYLGCNAYRILGPLPKPERS